MRMERTKRLGILTVLTLVLATVVGQLVTRALPPAGGADFVVPEGRRGVTIHGRLDRTAVLQGDGGKVMMELSLKAAESADERPRVPTDFLVVLDRSGSMSGDKLATARAAVRELVTQLDERDRLALVTYESGAEVTIPLARATEPARAEWYRIISAIESAGGTNMSLGLDLATNLLTSENGRHAARRILLLSDGHANEGDATPEGLRTRCLQAARSEAVLTTVGIGEGFNEFLMTSLADAGTGNFYYLQDREESPIELASIFTRELEATRETVARSLVVEIEPGDGVRVVDAAGYPLERRGGRVAFRPGSLFAGQERRIWVSLAVDGRGGSADVGRVTASYVRDELPYTIALQGLPKVERVQEVEDVYAQTDRSTWERSVVEEEYGRLRQRLARLVRDGQRDDALREIEVYRNEKSTMNEVLASDEVVSNLAQVEELKKEVEDAFTGVNQSQKQNILSKAQTIGAVDSRRQGSKKAVKTQ